MSNLAPPSFHSNLATVSIWHLLTNISNHPVFHRIQRSGLEQPLEQYIDSVSTKLTSFWFLKKRRSRRKKCIKGMAQIVHFRIFQDFYYTILGYNICSSERNYIKYLKFSLSSCNCQSNESHTKGKDLEHFLKGTFITC